MRELHKGDFVDFIDKPKPCNNAPWYLVHVASGSEKSTADYLRRQSFDVYAPVTRVMSPVALRHLSHKQRRHGASIKRPKVVPLFAGYQFVRIDMNSGRWHDVFRLRGVRGLVANDDQPARVPDALVEKIRSTELDGCIPGEETLAAIMGFEVGEFVRVTEGPFASFSAKIAALPRGYVEMLRTRHIDELDESTAVTLLVQLFGRETPVHATFAQIEKV